MDPAKASRHKAVMSILMEMWNPGSDTPRTPKDALLVFKPAGAFDTKEMIEDKKVVRLMLNIALEMQWDMGELIAHMQKRRQVEISREQNQKKRSAPPLEDTRDDKRAHVAPMAKEGISTGGKPVSLLSPMAPESSTSGGEPVSLLSESSSSGGEPASPISPPVSPVYTDAAREVPASSFAQQQQQQTPKTSVREKKVFDLKADYKHKKACAICTDLMFPFGFGWRGKGMRLGSNPDERHRAHAFKSFYAHFMKKCEYKKRSNPIFGLQHIREWMASHYKEFAIHDNEFITNNDWNQTADKLKLAWKVNGWIAPINKKSPQWTFFPVRA